MSTLSHFPLEQGCGIIHFGRLGPMAKGSLCNEKVPAAPSLVALVASEYSAPAHMLEASGFIFDSSLHKHCHGCPSNIGIYTQFGSYISLWDILAIA